MRTSIKHLAIITVAALLSFTSCDKEDPTYTLNLTVNPAEAGVVTGAGEYTEGTAVTITATPNEGYKFVSWTKGDTELSPDAEFSYTTTYETLTIAANFRRTTATVGAQLNTTYGGFLSVAEMSVYKQDDAFNVQDKIDILCFYEEYKDNFISLASPGSNIKDIFTGETAPENWTTKNQTYFTLPTSPITAEQFNALNEGDAAIETYYNAEQTSGNRMSKNLQVGDIRCFKTADGTFGILLVKEVGQGENGYAKFEVKTK